MEIPREDVIFDPTDPRAVELVGKEVWMFDRYHSENRLRAVYSGPSESNEYPFRSTMSKYRFIAPIKEQKCKFEEGQRILVSNDGKDWHERIFVRYDKNRDNFNFRTVLFLYENEWLLNRLEKFVVGYRYAKPFPEKKYQEFQTSVECLAQADKWIEKKDCRRIYYRIVSVHDTCVCIISFITGEVEYICYDDLFAEYQFADGTPCGKEVEE